MITSFVNYTPQTRKTCGGKGKCLVEMAENGFPIPDGFIINSDEFSKYCLENNLSDQPLESLSKKILEGEFSFQTTKEIYDLYDQMFPNNEKVAVRSSALCEDGYEYAWSGELETYLFVDKSNLLDCIKNCFASLFSQRALAYAKRVNISRDSLQVAVIIQAQLDSEFAGVAFSNNPLTGESEIIIEVVNGQGEQLVSGQIIPDHYIYSYDNKVLKEDLNPSIQHLSNEILARLLDQIKKLKDFYRYPIDIEWSVIENDIYILQCRPITTISSENKIESLVAKLLPTSKWNYDTSGAFHYMIMNTIMCAANDDIQDSVFGFHRQIEDCLRFNGQIFKSIFAKDYLNECIAGQINNDGDFLEKFAGKWNQVAQWESEYINRILAIDWKALSFDDLINETVVFGGKYKQSLVYVYYYIEGFLEEEFKKQLSHNYPSYSSELCDGIFTKIASCSNNLGELAYSEEPIELLRLAIKKEHGEDISHALDNHIQKYSWMLAPIEREFRIFDRRHYEQRMNEMIAEHNAEQKLFELLKNRHDNDVIFEQTIQEHSFPPELVRFATNIRTFIFYRTLLTERSDYLFFNGRITIIREIARRTGIEENDLVMLSVDEIVRYLEKKLSKEYVQKLAHGRAEHYAIVFLSGSLMTFEGEDAVYLENAFVPLYVREKQNSSPTEVDANILVQGTTCYPGRVVGRAKIVRDVSDCDKVEKGDILVANMTTPNFISAMERAGGFLTDQGGITCHAAILSREMKIPCIIGTSIATRILHDNDLIELDAFSGVVRLIK